MKTYKLPIAQSRCWLAGFFLLTGATWAAAADGVDPADWKFGGDIYLWGASIGGETAGGGDLDISFSDLLKNLDMAFMGMFTAQKGKWGLVTDVVYLNVDAENNGQINLPIGPGGLPVPTDTDVGLKSWIVTPTVRYNLIENDKGSLGLVGGARYLWIDVTLKAKVEGPLETRKRKIEDSGSNWDGIVGVSGQIELADKWYLPYYLDVGTGQSDLTWQASAVWDTASKRWTGSWATVTCTGTSTTIPLWTT